MPDSMYTSQLQGTYIGCKAREQLCDRNTFTVMGVTSRGIFLSRKDREIVFISLEDFRGPLTINVIPAAGDLLNSQWGDHAELQGNWLRFDRLGLTVDLQKAVTWEVPGLPENLLTAEERQDNLRIAVQQVLAAREGQGLSALLKTYLYHPQLPDSEDQTNAAVFELEKLRKAFTKGNLQAAQDAAGFFLGLGSGLTPSGDDLLLGVLLAANRWSKRLAFSIDLKMFSQAIIEKAGEKTTRLSASLLASAAQGLADERLIIAIDGLFSGRPGPTSCVEHLLAWGSSSGCDALVGMALVISAVSSTPVRSGDVNGHIY